MNRKDAKHLAFVRSLGCCVPQCHTGLPVHAHHVRTAATAGMGLKSSDRNTVPLCSDHHGELHWSGQKTFEAKYGITLADEARRLAINPPTENML